MNRVRARPRARVRVRVRVPVTVTVDRCAPESVDVACALFTAV